MGLAKHSVRLGGPSVGLGGIGCAFLWDWVGLVKYSVELGGIGQTFYFLIRSWIK